MNLKTFLMTNNHDTIHDDPFNSKYFMYKHFSTYSQNLPNY